MDGRTFAWFLVCESAMRYLDAASRRWPRRQEQFSLVARYYAERKWTQSTVLYSATARRPGPGARSRRAEYHLEQQRLILLIYDRTETCWPVVGGSETGDPPAVVSSGRHLNIIIHLRQLCHLQFAYDQGGRETERERERERAIETVPTSVCDFSARITRQGTSVTTVYVALRHSQYPLLARPGCSPSRRAYFEASSVVGCECWNDFPRLTQPRARFVDWRRRCWFGALNWSAFDHDFVSIREDSWVYIQELTFFTIIFRDSGRCWLMHLANYFDVQSILIYVLPLHALLTIG